VSAVFELNSALIAMRRGQPKADEVKAIYGELATAYDKLKQVEHAKQAREYAKLIVATDPAPGPGTKPGGRKAPPEDDESL
jgi:hypothetical protein